MNRILLFIAILLLNSSYANSYELALNGISAYYQLNKEYYLLSLSAENKIKTAQDLQDLSIAKRIELKVTTDEWTIQNFTNTWIRDLSINNDLSSNPTVTKSLIKFAKMPKTALVAGDSIVIEYLPLKGTVVSINGITVIETPNDEFFNYIANSWIGKYPPSRKFKEEILAAGKFDSEARKLISRFDTLSINYERSTLVATWNAKAKKEQALIASRKRQEKEDLQKSQRAAAVIKKAEREVAKLERAKAEIEKEKAALAILSRLESDSFEPTGAGEQPVVQYSEIEFELPQASMEIPVDPTYQMELYEWEMKRKVYGNVKYPHWAKQLSQKGKVTVEFKVNKDGSIERNMKIDAAKAELLGKELKRAIIAAAPFSSLPESFQEETHTFSITYDFKDGRTADVLPRRPQQLADITQ